MVSTTKIVQVIFFVAAFAAADAEGGEGGDNGNGGDVAGEEEEAEGADSTEPPSGFAGAAVGVVALPRPAKSAAGPDQGDEKEAAGLADGMRKLPDKAAQPPAKEAVKKLKRPHWVKRTYVRRHPPSDDSLSVGVGPAPKACPEELPLTQLPAPACRVWLAQAAGTSMGVGGVGDGAAGPGGTTADKLYRAKSFPNLVRRVD